MANSLTKPQAEFMLRAMKAGFVSPRGSQWVTADALGKRGFVEMGPSLGTRQLTRAGFDALLYYWRCKDANSGRMADLMRREEVEAALAARFPEPVAA